MNWLIFIIVIGPEGSFVGNEGAPLAITDSEVICNMIGGGLADDLTNAAIIARAGIVFDYRCVFDGVAA